MEMTDLPPEEPRFAFEHAEAVFDEFNEVFGDAEFRRAMAKTKAMAAIYAWSDHYCEDTHPATALARGWEEMQIAFTGRGEAFMTGAVLHLWNCLPPGITEAEFEAVVREAFEAAEEHTPQDAPRLYLQRYRNAEIRHPDDGFTLDPILPMAGVRVRDWAETEGHDCEAIEDALTWIELADREGRWETIRQEFGPDADDEPTPPQPRLTLLPGGRS